MQVHGMTHISFVNSSGISPILFPNLAALAIDLNLPVNTAVGAYRRKWEVVRDFVIAQDHIHLRAGECIGGIVPRWDALQQCYHLDRRFGWEELIMRVHNTIPTFSPAQAKAGGRRPRAGPVLAKPPPPRYNGP